jgi:hypothetical protein
VSVSERKSAALNRSFTSRTVNGSWRGASPLAAAVTSIGVRVNSMQDRGNTTRGALFPLSFPPLWMTVDIDASRDDGFAFRDNRCEPAPQVPL